MASSANSSSDPYVAALQKNKQWADSTKTQHPNFLSELSKGQAPKILWIGCSDSRVPETTILNLSPGDVFVHRNIANIVNPTDLSALSVIEFAVANLKVQHIVLCGHTSCGGVTAALGNKKIGKIDTWLIPLRRLRKEHADELTKISDDSQRNRRLVELNVAAGIEVLRENPDVIDAMKERGLQVHGVVYDLASGELQDLNIEDNQANSRKFAFECE